MTDFNDKIKTLLAFSASFEEFKSELEIKLNHLSKPTDLSGLVKKDELAKTLGDLSSIQKDIKSLKGKATEIESVKKELQQVKDLIKSLSELKSPDEQVRLMGKELSQSISIHFLELDKRIKELERNNGE